jgi:hypothetical protein
MAEYLSVASLLLCGGLMAGRPAALAAQNVPGVTGTIAPDSTITETDAAGHTIVGGLKALFRGKGNDDELAHFREGNSVTVRYERQGAAEPAGEVDRAGADTPPTTEGVVTEVDRKRRTITIRFANGSKNTLRLADHQTANAGRESSRAADEGATVVVYYVDQAGRRIGLDFKKAS